MDKMIHSRPEKQHDALRRHLAIKNLPSAISTKRHTVEQDDDSAHYDRHEQDPAYREVDSDIIFPPSEKECLPDDNGIIGDPTDLSEVIDVTYYYDLETTGYGASILEQEILPAMETSIDSGIASIFIPSCGINRRNHRALEMVAVENNPSSVVKTATCSSSLQSEENVCSVIEGTVSIYLDGVTEEEAEKTRKNILYLIEYNMDVGYFNSGVDPEIVGVTYAGDSSETFQVQSESVTLDTPIIYMIVAAGGVVAMILVVSAVIYMRRNSEPKDPKKLVYG